MHNCNTLDITSNKTYLIMKKIVLCVALSAIATALLCGIFIQRMSQENQRLRRNQHSLLQEVELYRTRAGDAAASVEALTLQLDEFREQRAEDADYIRSLNIRLRRAESYAKSVVASRYTATLPLRDTIILHDTIRDTVRIFAFNDAWSSLAGHIANDTLHYNLHTIDTLRQVIHRIPHRFLFIPYGTKAIRQEITSSNPHTTLIYTEYIELDKKHRKRR